MSRTTLEAARNLIANAPHLARGSYVKPPENQSWRPGQPVPDGSCFCIMGAVAVVHDLDYVVNPNAFDGNADIEALAQGIAHTYRDAWMTIADWNDADGRTREDVVALFDKVIATAE